MKTLITSFLFLIMSFFCIAQSSLDSGLVAYYPFNGNANDESGNGNDGFVTNALLTQNRFNQNDEAYYFNGSNARIEIPGSDILNLIGDISISAWVNPEEIQTSGNRLIVGKSNYLNATNYIFRVTPNGFIQWEYFTSLFTNNNQLTINNWYHIVLTADSTTGIKQIYVNGDLILSQVVTGSGPFGIVTNPLTIGAAKHYGTTWAEFFKGSIDDIRIYNRIIDSSEVSLLYNETGTVSVVSSVFPHQNSNYFQPDETIKVFFTQPMDSASIVSANTTWRRVYVHGSLTGKYSFNVLYHSSNNSLEIVPTTTLKYGELITVSLDSLIITASGNNITPYVFQFNVKPEIGTVKFAVADSFQLNFSPTNIVSGDFNNDGKVDVIVSNYDSLKYTVLLNNGAGGFTLGEEMTGEFKPYSISFTDIDNDRDLDMIVSTNEQNKIRLLRGTGQGIFGWILPYIDVNAPVATCPGDFDGDGDNDFVALLNYGLFDGRAYLYKNDGTGSFTQSGYVNIGFPASQRNVVGDFDNDGDLDILGGTSDYWGVYKILVNDGNGNFTYTGGPYIGPYPDELAGGDFNGDYDLDFIKCDWYQSGIQIGLNDGSGTYNILNLGNVGGSPRNPAVNDFDGDGDLDNANTNGNSIQILTNNGSLNFVLDNYPLGVFNGISAADFDGNGSVDLVGISSATNQIKFLINCVNGLVANWQFSGNLTDTAGNFNNGLNYGGTYDFDRYGNANNSIYFEGSTSYTEGINPGNNLPTGSTPRTFACWVKSSETTVSRNIFHYGTAEAAPTNYHLFLQEGKYVGIGNGYGFGFLQSSKNIGDNTWHFITTVYEGSSSNLQHIYIDGKLDISDVISSTPNTVLTNNWKMGQFMGGSPSFLGNIDDLQIYNLALTDQAIWDMYKARTTAPNLLFPGNDSTLINNLTPLMDWDSTVTANAYRIIIANDSLFSVMLIDTVINSSSFQVYEGLLIHIDNLYWKVRTINDGGIGPWSEINHFSFLFTDVKEETQLPTEFALLQNYPNPFNPSTTITYHLPKTTVVVLKVFDVLGNEIATLVNEEKAPGVYKTEFNPVSSINYPASGIYFYQLKAGDYLETKKMILMK